MSRSKPIEVAVVGGGCAGLTAAFELSRPEHRGRFHVTVYQVGWRLGGKGASGRGAADRIEEHGLHVWMGFYENAFRLMRECYAELGRDPKTCRIATWRDAFFPDPYVCLTERCGNDRGGDDWRFWTAFFPEGHGNPGDPLRDENPFTVAGYLSRCATLLRSLLVSACDQAAPPGRRDRPEPSVFSPETLLENINRLLRYGQLATMAGVLEACRLLEGGLASVVRAPDNLILRLIDAVAAGARRLLETLCQTNDETRRIWELVDLVLAILRGSVRFGLATHPKGFDAIDDYDWREWLRLNGASEAALDSAFLRGVYDLLFAYEDGDPERPRMAAGQALRGAVRMFFTYRGALFWKMSSGMGDIVFAPLYEVLRRRGVSFRFFHRLENVRLADPAQLAPGERPYVESLELDVQAEIEGDEYRPLIDVRGLPCWPAAPDWDQLVDGPRLRDEDWRFESFWDRRKAGQRTLRVTEDFDFVVLALGLGAIPHVARDILARDPRWRDMVRHVKTVETQAFQLWLKEDARGLGWTGPAVNLSSFVEPFDTWADMRQLIPEESWPVPPRSIAYFCNVLPGPAKAPGRSRKGYPAERHKEVRENAVRFLERDIVQLWPRAAGPGGFRWDLLAAPDSGVQGEAQGEARFNTQFWTANVNPSDRYVLTLPGSSKHRISPLDNTYDNLTIAGDWTDCGHNAGCVEAAVIAGRLAAHSLSGSPALEDIVGYDHP